MSDSAVFTDSKSSNPPKWFWIISGIGLVWNLLGVAAFINQMTMDLSGLAEAERIFYETTPGWAISGFAVAVFGGSLGCLALLFRQSWAIPMLLACLLGLVVQISHSIFVGNGIEVFGPAGFLLPALTFVIALALVWFARYSGEKGWLKRP